MDGDAYGGLLFGAYGSALLRRALHFRWLVILALILSLRWPAIWGFGQVKQQFFPNSNTPISSSPIYTLQQGTPIAKTSDQMRLLEEFLDETGRVWCRSPPLWVRARRAFC
jgi:multidrug efflux pump subunit AcrB